MKLYKKQLGSLEELKRERHLLQYIKKQQDPGNLFSLSDITGAATGSRQKASASAGGNDLLELLLSLAGSGSLADAAFRAGGPLLKLAARKFPKKILFKLLSEVGGGYLKWKLLSGGFALLRHLVVLRREHRKAEAWDRAQEKARQGSKSKGAHKAPAH